MKENDLTHELTPQTLRELNTRLVASLASEDEESRYQLLNDLVEERDNFIRQYLASLDSADAEKFAKMELSVNDKLKQLAQTLLASAKKDMSHFVRSQSAIKKYK